MTPIVQFISIRGHRGRDLIVVGFITCEISAYYNYSCECEPCSWRGVMETTLCDKSLSVTCDRSVVFHGYSGFLHQ